MEPRTGNSLSAQEACRRRLVDDTYRALRRVAKALCPGLTDETLGSVGVVSCPLCGGEAVFGPVGLACAYDCDGQVREASELAHEIARERGDGI